MQFGEQLWLKRDPRLWRAPSRPKVLAQYLFKCVGGAAGPDRRQTQDKKKKTDEKIEKKSTLLVGLVGAMTMLHVEGKG